MSYLFTTPKQIATWRLCLPHEEREQPEGNWLTVRTRVHRIARAAAAQFQSQGLTGTDLYLSALGPALGEVGRNWPVTDYAGHEIALEDALDEAYKAVGGWRLEQILAELTAKAVYTDELLQGFTAKSVDRNTQTLWLWLDIFQGDIAGSDDVRRLARSLNVNPDGFRNLGLLRIDKDTFVLQAPPAVDLKALSRKLLGVEPTRGRGARQTDVWEERSFPGFIGAACWNAIGIMLGTEDVARGPEVLRQWLRVVRVRSSTRVPGSFSRDATPAGSSIAEPSRVRPLASDYYPSTTSLGPGAARLARVRDEFS